MQVLSAGVGDQSISKCGRGNSAGGLGQSRNEKTSLVSLVPGLPETLWDPPFLFPWLGQQWSRAQVLMGPSWGQGITKNQKHFLGPQEMENAWNEYLKLESDVEQLKQTLQEQHRRAFFFQVTQGLFIPSEV